MELREYITTRALQTLVTFIISVAIIFFLFRIMPGDPVSIVIRFGAQGLTEEEIQTLRAVFGLDRPLHEQFFIYLWNVMTLNLGKSFFYGIPVSELLITRLANTIILVGLGTLFSIVIGLLLGVAAGWYRGSKIDTAALSFSLLFYSMPSFWIGMVFIYLFSILLNIFPTGGIASVRISEGADIITRLLDQLHHLALPLITYSLGFAGQYALVMRNTLIGVLQEDYILTARAKGLTGSQIIRRHALKNASLPTITLVAINVGLVVLGTISIETVFSWPGVGRLVYEAILFRDFPVLQGTFILFTVFMLLANFIADITYAILDPRVRY